jgi:hypothetical protein
MLRSLSCVVASFTVWMSLTALTFAQLPMPTWTSLYPPGAKQGSTVEVTVAGTNLDDAEKLLFSHPGITGTPKTSPPNDFNAQPTKVPNQFTITVAADVPPGFYEVRHVGRYGATNPRVFQVGTLEEIVEQSDNSKRETAPELKLNSTANGRVNASNLDYWVLPLEAGQRVLFDCAAERLDSRLNASLILYGPDGREVARALDSVGQDPVLDFAAKQAGRYTIAVYDFVYDGSPDYYYRLSVSGTPFIDFVLPAAAQAGTTGQFTLYGRNLPGGQPSDIVIGNAALQKLAVTIPIPVDALEKPTAVDGSAPLRTMFVDNMAYSLSGPQGNSNTVMIGVASQPVIAEQEPNDGTHPQKITLPCEYVGQFYPQRDEDWVQFEAKKGEIYQIEVISHRLGRNSDPAMLVQRVSKNDKGEQQFTDVAFVDDPQTRATKIGDDFDTSTDDPSYKFVAPEDSTYRVMVRDQFGDARSDPRFTYRLVIRATAPDFRLGVFPDLPGVGKQDNQINVDTLVLPKGGTALLKVNVERRDDFDGEIELRVEGLPTGITCPGALLGGKVDSGILILQSDDNAAAWSGAIRVIGTAKVNDKAITRTAAVGTVTWGTQNKQNGPVRYRLMRDLVLSVTDKEPAIVQVKAGTGQLIENAIGGKLELPIQVTRRGQLKDPLKIVLYGLSKEVKAKDLTLDAAINDGKIEIDLTGQNLKPGAYTFCLRADSKLSYARNPEQVTSLEAEQKQLQERMQQLQDKQKQSQTALNQTKKSAAESKAAVQQLEKQLSALKPDDATRADIDRKLQEAKTKSQQVEESLQKATQESTDLTEKVKTGDAMKKQLDSRLADVKKNAAPKDINVSYLSTGIKLRLHAAPVTLETPSSPLVIKAGEKQETEIKLTRLFEFKEAVEITLDAPNGVAGLQNAKGTITADKTSVKIELAPQKNTPPGEHTFTVKAKGKYGQNNFESVGKLVVKVEAAPQ